MVVSHIEPQLDITGEGLGKESKQTGESGHSKITKEMSRFERNSYTNHSKRILAEVKRFVCKRFTILEM